ncbi:unannotated protein [freshwater metagenome]|uniref:Unannotated protein n=1 Tax=freshwater metagenome TaxID=449393 RepID=A0A6J7JT09_9ZZZZ
MGVSIASFDSVDAPLDVPSTSRKSAVSGSSAPGPDDSAGVSAPSESDPGGVVEDMTTAGGVE